MGMSLAGLFSKRVRELERINADLRAMLDEDYDKVSLARMEVDETGKIEASFKSSIGGRILAAWAANTLKAVGAENYIEFGLYHPEGGLLTILVSRQNGETPAAKANRLERELMELRAAKAPSHASEQK